MAAGTYSSFPMDAHPMGGPGQLTDVQQQRLLRQLDHMLYSKLLKVCSCRQIVMYVSLFIIH